MSSIAVANKPHAVCIPLPFQSHIKAMLQFAQLLHHKGFHITFVNTEFNHNRFLKSIGPNSVDRFPDFRFETIPDGLPSSDEKDSQEVILIIDSIRKKFLSPFRNLINKLNGNMNVPVTSIVSDGFMKFTITVAEELGIPVAHFFTLAAVGFMNFKLYPTLVEKGFAPLKDESSMTDDLLDTVIDWVPGLKDIRLRDLSGSWRTTNPDDVMFNFNLEAVEGAHKASALIVHTFEALEPDALEALSSTTSMLPPVYAIGPLQLLLNKILEHPLKSVGYSLRKEETECLQWLNGKALNSVLYVNFGSIVVMTPQQLMEFAWGLSNSKLPFLWIIRPDLVRGESTILPPEFVAETKERGLIASWCPQEQVLNHPSVGGFLTHSGWHSTMESISAGVPMLCWPVLADQRINCRYTCNEWGIGMEISKDVKKEEVKKLVEELIVGAEKGKEMKNKAMELKKLAEEAAGPLGSSSITLNNLVSQVLLSKC